MALTIEAEVAPLRVDRDGVVRVGETRIPIDTVIAAYAEGHSAEGIVEQFPSLEVRDVYAVIAYYLRHRPEVDAYLQGRQHQAEKLRREHESHRPSGPGLRERLMARQHEKGASCASLPGGRESQ